MTNTIPNVPRDDLDLIRSVLEGFKPCIARDDALRTVRTILSAPSPAGVDGLEVVGVLCISRFRNNHAMENVEFQITADVEPGQHDLCRLSDAKAIIDGLRGEVAKINSDRLACWAEFKVMTRACLDAEKERDQQAETIANYKSQFSELHAARNLLSRLSAAGFELGDDAAVSVIAERDQQAQRIGELERALLEVAASLAWNAHGECRAIHDGPIMPSQMAIDAAKAVLSAGKEGE